MTQLPPTSPGPLQHPVAEYRPANGLVMTLTILFVGIALLEVFIGVEALLDMTGVIDYESIEDETTALDPGTAVLLLAIGCTFLVYVVALLATIIVYCCWIHRANRNARALGAADMQFTPGWCVGWWFIPVANIFKPYQAVAELFRASDPDAGEHWRTASVPAMLGTWWACWIICNVLGNLSLKLSLREDPDMVTAGLWVDVIAAPIWVVAALLALKILRTIHANQQRIAGAMAQ